MFCHDTDNLDHGGIWALIAKARGLMFISLFKKGFVCLALFTHIVASPAAIVPPASLLKQIFSNPRVRTDFVRSLLGMPLMDCGKLDGHIGVLSGFQELERLRRKLHDSHDMSCPTLWALSKVLPPAEHPDAIEWAATSSARHSIVRLQVFAPSPVESHDFYRRAEVFSRLLDEDHFGRLGHILDLSLYGPATGRITTITEPSTRLNCALLPCSSLLTTTHVVGSLTSDWPKHTPIEWARSMSWWAEFFMTLHGMTPQRARRMPPFMQSAYDTFFDLQTAVRQTPAATDVDPSERV